MSANSNAPVIIKRKKSGGGDGHHGGAWKVAYADFVTAMMAFFMLMWLLNATTEKQRKGIADYFSPTTPINRISGGGDGSFGGDSVFSEETLARNGTGASMKRPTEARAARGDTGVDPTDTSAGEDARNFAKVEEAFSAMAGESMVGDDALRHIITRVTDEGLVVEIFDLPGAALFDEATDQPSPIMVELTRTVARVFNILDNGIAIHGHTRAHPLVLKHNPVWDLSAARADRTRELLEEAGVVDQRVQRISGHADRKLAAANPMAERNNRVEIVLLRKKTKE